MDIGPHDAKRILEKTILIDVRTPQEFFLERIGKAKNIDINNKFEEQIKGLDKEETYLLYCRTGARSGYARDIMLKEGFKRVFNLSGGILFWKQLRLQTGSEEV